MFHAARNERIGAAVVTRPADLDEAEVALLDAIAALPVPADRGPATPDRALAPGSSLTGRRLDVLLDAQLASRFLDHAARWLRAEGQGFYTIGSAGHEANALVAAALRPTDPALLHYRSGGFYLARAQQVADHDGVGDILRGLLAASDEPIAGGRHKVFGHHDLAVIPQTSTIASHLPRALGVAFAIGHARNLGVPIDWPADAVAVCSFGDASLNHSTAQGALNAAAWMEHAGWPLPLLFVCEDNGLGISVPTPAGWVARSLAGRGLRYEYVDGTDPVAVFDATEELAEAARERGEPSILHLRTVRYGGHAGSDVEAAYRDPALVRADRDRRPGRRGRGRAGRRRAGDPGRARAAGTGGARRRASAGGRPDLVPPVGLGRRGDGTAGASPSGGGGRRGRGPRRRRRRTGHGSRSPSRSTGRSGSCSRPTTACWCSVRTSVSRAACTE